MNSQSLARGLAFFSVGLGLAELLAPRQVQRLIGVEGDNDNLLRFLGLREMGAGMGILQGNSATFVWSRVAGDAMDLGLLAAALRSGRNNRNRVIGAMAAVAGVTALDIVGGILLSRNPTQPEWRVARADQAGMERGDPIAMRDHADRTMSEHESGHLRRDRSPADEAEEMQFSRTNQASMRSRENSATQEFAPGD